MNSYDGNDGKDMVFLEELFEKIFESIRKMYMDNNFGRSDIDINDNKIGPNKQVAQRFNINIEPLPHEKPNEFEFKNIPQFNLDGDREKPDNSEFLIDMMEGDKKITVTVSIPNVEKEDISLNVTDVFLEIIINTSKVKYHKLHKLPCNVKPKATMASYKNGVLDVVMERKEEKNPQKGHRANID